MTPDSATQQKPFLGREPHRNSASRWLVIAILAMIVTAFYVPGWQASGIAGTLYIVIYAIFSVVMLVLWRSKIFTASEVLWLGVALRVALVLADPLTSNDSQRYLWDGAVALSGFDPYSVAPDNPLVARLREIWPTPPEHAKYPTLYPPAAVAIFALAASAGPDWGFLVWKTILTGASIASLFLMRAVLAGCGRTQHLALFALSPLLVLETGIGAHLDGLVVLVIAAMTWAHARGKWGAMGVALGWGACIKFLPLMLLVPLFWLLRSDAFARVAASAAAMIGAIYGGALLAGHLPLGILPTFFEKWRGGSPLFAALELLFEGPFLLGAIGCVAGLGFGLAAFLAHRRQGAFACTIALSMPLLLSPVVFPWYLCPLVPLLALRPTATLLLWTTSVSLTYEVLDKWLSVGEWAPASWPMAVIAAGWIIGLMLDARSGAEPPGRSLRFVALRSRSENRGHEQEGWTIRRYPVGERDR